MASLSLPRVLQLKKNSLDAEREQFEKFQTLAIQKAINAIETPVKEKHVRSTLIGTFQEQSAITYWMVAIRQPIQENRIVAWKFCNVTHKLLREGHPACLDDSQRHIGMIQNLGNLWVHLREGYGKLVHLYCALLVCKLKFHARNPRFPGNMQLTADELDNIAENDVNNYFQLCVELFDYMDDILNLQAAVFDSLGNARANSMTASGQCRLAALIPCAQDASQIYDCNVRLLFRLHASLPPDTLAGHRERFRQQFKKLSSFYKHASSLQYYRNLLTLPVLPSNPPNFLLQSDFGTYVTPVVSIPDQPPDEPDAVASLIDTSDTMSQMSAEHLEDLDVRPTPSPQPDPIVERDRLIDHLQNELKRMRSEVSQMVQERNTMLGSMKEHCSRIETQLRSAQAELQGERQKAQLLAVQTPEIQQKLSATEEKAKVTDEKFQKLKGAYTQLREEHITLIRQKAEVDKLATTLRAASTQHESAKAALQQQLNDKIKDVELLQQSASSSEEIEAYKTEIANLRAEIEQSRLKEVELENLKASMEALQIEHTTATKEQEEKFSTIANELKETQESLENIKKEKDERDLELSRVKEELVGLKEKSGDEYKKVVEEKAEVVSQLEELKQKYAEEKEEITRLNDVVYNLQDEITLASDEALKAKEKEKQEALEKLETIQTELNDTKTKLSVLQQTVQELTDFKSNAENVKVELENEKEKINIELTSLQKEKQRIEEELNEKNNEISEMEIMFDMEHTKNEELIELEDQLQKTISEKTNELVELKKMIDEGTFASNEALIIKDKEKQEALEQLQTDLHHTKTKYKEEISKYVEELSVLQKNVQALTDFKDSAEKVKAELEKEKEEINIELTSLQKEKQRIEEELNDKNNEISEMEIMFDMEHTKNEELIELQDQLQKTITEKTNELAELKKQIDEGTFASNEALIIKDKEKQEALETLQTELHDTKTKYEVEISKYVEELSALQKTVQELTDFKENAENVEAELVKEMDDIDSKLSLVLKEKQSMEEELKDKINEISEMEIMLDMEHTKNEELIGLEDELQKTINEKTYELAELKRLLDEKSNVGEKQQSESQTLSKQIVEVEATLSYKNKEIEQLNTKLNESAQKLQELSVSYEDQIKELNCKITILTDKLQNVTECKDEIITNLKNMVEEKDKLVISMNVEVTKLSEDNIRLKDELEETKAELEIGQNELFTLKEEHDTIIDTNEDNLSLKNKELRLLNTKINEISREKIKLEMEKEKIISVFTMEKEVMASKITELQTLTEKIQTEISEKDENLSKARSEIGLLKETLDQLQGTVKEKEGIDELLSERNQEKQLLDTRLVHTEQKRLNAECELQDLLQHNSVLEADLAALKRKLEEANRNLELRTSQIVKSAGAAAVEVTDSALSALEHGSVSDNVAAATELAAKALEDLAGTSNIQGNEESVVKSAISVAHNTAQLSAYVADVTNVSTNIELADKLTAECRSMLTATKICLESISTGGIVSSNCASTEQLVRNMLSVAKAADVVGTGPRSVDDELADMDLAIGEAAAQIESMLAATKAGDSGVKLEVNAKILDACTTLMAAVKVLVQDARKLQQELGDTKTRQKMYRKNPQWSEGLISAAKAVVFAAKLLVSSADEAVSGSGQTEGVSAAAHEVGGSTAQLVAASRARASPDSAGLARLTAASRAVAAATGALLAAVKTGSALVIEQEALDTSKLTLTATRRLEMESKVRSLKLETALDAERAKLAALRKRHYQLAQMEENGNMENGKE